MCAFWTFTIPKNESARSMPERPSLILHIGTPKTGTTSFQRWCAENREPLKARNLQYPETTGAINHYSLMVLSSRKIPKDPIFRKHKVDSPETQAAFRERIRTALKAEIAGSDCTRFLISNEHLWSRLGGQADIRALKDFLSEMFGRIDVVVHLRPQIDLIVSNSSQAIRMGKPVDSSYFQRTAVGERSRFFNYDDRVGLWEGVFGEDRVHPVPFRLSPDIRTAIFRRFDVDDTDLSDVPRTNEAMGWRTIALGNALIATGLVQELGLKKTYADILAAMPKSEPVQVGLGVARAVQDRFAESNARLIARRPDLDEGSLDPDWARYDGPANIGRIDDAAVLDAEIAAALRVLAAQPKKKTPGGQVGQAISRKLKRLGR